MMQVTILSASIVFVTALLVLSIHALRMSKNIIDSWTRVEDAVVLEVQFTTRAIWTWSTVIFEYDSGEARHVSEDTPTLPALAVTAKHSQYRPGDQLVAYVNPDNYQDATIAPQRYARLGCCGIGTAIACLALVGLSVIGL